MSFLTLCRLFGRCVGVFVKVVSFIRLCAWMFDRFSGPGQ